MSKTKKKNEDEEDEKSFEEKVLEARYKQRFSLIKIAKMSIDGGDPHQAIRSFEELFDALSHHHKVKILDLNPIHIRGRQAVAEKLLLSHCFYNMARLMDLKVDEESQSKVQLYLNQFAKFTLNQPFQSVNTRMLYQHLNKTKFRNKNPFDLCYKKIMAESKMCFFANYCFGENHPITQHFRTVKLKMLKTKWGSRFVEIYYNYSGSIVQTLEFSRFISILLKNIILRPFFYLVYLISRVIHD